MGEKLWKKKRQRIWQAMSWMNMCIGYIQENEEDILKMRGAILIECL